MKRLAACSPRWPRILGPAETDQETNHEAEEKNVSKAPCGDEMCLLTLRGQMSTLFDDVQSREL